MAKVIHLDDSKVELEAVASILKEAGHQVSSYSETEGIEEKVATEKPDLILLDLVMPKRSGYEVLRSLKTDDRTKETPIVVVSSKASESDISYGKSQGADDYLGKPYKSDQILAAVKRFTR